jgi:hypothetical protein
MIGAPTSILEAPLSRCTPIRLAEPLLGDRLRLHYDCELFVEGKVDCTTKSFRRTRRPIETSVESRRLRRPSRLEHYRSNQIPSTVLRRVRN